jgi:phosphate starvation-inducible protein PhoH and related proteins
MSQRKSTKKQSKKELNNEGQEAMSRIQENKNQKSVFNKNTFLNLKVELTPKQHELYKMIRNNAFTIVQGPAGTSKTFSACYTALGLLADGKIDRIIITKPLVEANEKSMGFLPGTMQEKIEPHMKSYFHNFEKIVGKFMFDAMLAAGIIEINVLNFMRGDTLDNALMIMDEAQNLTMSEAMLWITRMGKTSKAVMMGDVSQYDIKKRDAKFLNFIDILADIEEVKHFKFTEDDIMRHELLKKIVERYEKWKYKNDGISNTANSGENDGKMIKS